MKKFKANKKATKGKVKSWKKGDSCAYNPKCNKFRSEAKKQATFGYQGGSSNLTESALARLNKATLDNESHMDEDPNFDGLSVGGQSFVSTFSHCTNPSFNRLLKHWRSDSMLHKEMLAVLAAVTDVIKMKGGKETETEYFAALMTTLDVVESDEALTAVITLLYMIVKRLSSPILRYNFKDSCTTLKKILLKYSSSDYNALLRNLLGCLYHFLKAQDGVSWTDVSSEIFNTLVEFCVHQKPKVRKSAQNAVRSLLSMFDKTAVEGAHPAAVSTAQFCIQKLESSGGSQTSMHVLNLLQDILGYFPKAKLKLCCETILKTMTLSDAIVITNCLGVLRGLFSMNPKHENLPMELNVRIIKALYDYRPNVNDGLSLTSWLLVMEHSFLNLYRLDSSVCLSHLPKLFKVLVSCWLSDREEVYPAVASTMNNVLVSCIIPTSSEFQQFMLNDPINNPMHQIFHCVESALSYQYHRAWKQVLFILATFFDIMGKHSHTVMMKCLQSMADLRDSFKFPHIAELDKAFGVAIRCMGPEIVLKAVPLQIDTQDEKLDFPRSWLLPLLRDNVKETELGFFIRYFLPLALTLRKKGFAAAEENKFLKAKTYEILCSQVWSLLPGFCTLPTDLKQSFKNIAEILGTTLNKSPDLRIPVLSSLRILITKNMENEENRKVLSYFAKNYLPILFNLYTSESKTKGEEGVRLAVYDTIKIYVKIADKALCEKLFCEVMKNLQSNDGFLKQSHLDLNKALLPYVNENLVAEFYNFCKPLLQDLNHTTQKKSYSVLNELCSNDACSEFVKLNLEDLKTILLTSLSNSSPSSKALRLNCLSSIIKQLSKDNKEFIVSVVPEATLCTKETAVKARTNAFKLLSEIGHILKEWEPDNGKGVLRDYMQMLLAGFAGNPHMISATILAVGHVMYEFKSDIDTDIIHLLIENICLLLTSKSREVVTSALSFIKILFSVVSTDNLAQHVEYLVKSITAISEDNQRHFRFKAKELLTRLIRKFGYEMISKLAPEKFQKQLANIRKIEARKMKKKDKKYDTDDESEVETESVVTRGKDEIEDILRDTDDELDMDDFSEKQKPAKRSRKTKARTWIEEKSENDIIDFLDPAASKKILASKPGTSTKIAKGKSSNEFEISEDGRLIITDEQDTNSKGNGDIEMNENVKKGKKRKLGDSDDEDIDDQLPSTSTKSVTKGIHRILNKAKLAPGAQYKAKKASGDVKKGKFDPYAHITFDYKLLNKRKQKKLQSQFKGLVHSARAGAKKGLKMKAKANKNRKKT